MQHMVPPNLEYMLQKFQSPSPPEYPYYSACCSRVETNPLRTNAQYNVIVEPARDAADVHFPIHFQLLVCEDSNQCPEICPHDCKGNGWCNTTSRTCICDNGYVGEDCASCPTCNYTPTTGSKLYLGIFTTMGMAVLVVGIIPIVTIVAIISTVVFIRRQAKEQQYLRLPIHSMHQNKIGASLGEDDNDSDGDGDGDAEAGTGGGDGGPVLFRTSDNTVMYSPSVNMAPRKYTAVPLQAAPNGTQIFQLDE